MKNIPTFEGFLNESNEMDLIKESSIVDKIKSLPVAHIYEIVRRDRRGRRTAGYIPSHYRNYSQTKEINSTRF